MEITSNRITATPRSKYHKYGIATSNGISNSSGSANIDLSNFVKKTGETEQTIEGNVLATGDIIAYSTGQSVENYPIASSTALGTIKVGQNLTIDEDGTLNAQAGGGTSNWNEIQGKPTLLTDTNIQKWETNSHTHTNKAVLDTITADSIHTHANKSYLDSINQNLSKTSDVNFGSVKATGDIIAYSTGASSAPFKYWYPSVNSSGDLSWTDSTSETVPKTVNIKGAKGDTGDASKGGLINGLTWLRNPSSGSICYITGNAVSGYTSGSPNLWLNWSPTAVASGTSCSYSYRTLKVGGKQEGVAILTVNDGNSGSFAGTYAGSSDIRLKDNIEYVNNVLTAIEDIDIFKFTYKDDDSKTIHYGVSAQKVQPHFPELITLADNEEYGQTLVLKYIEFNTLMAVGGVKELYQLVKQQQSKIEELESRISELETNK